MYHDEKRRWNHVKSDNKEIWDLSCEELQNPAHQIQQQQKYQEGPDLMILHLHFAGRSLHELAAFDAGGLAA
jgi:hypothetical protein